MNQTHSQPGGISPPTEPTDDDLISVLIVEDHRMFGRLLADHLDGESDIHVAGVMASASQAMQFFDTSSVDVVLMDYWLPDGDGISLTTQIRNKHREVRIIMVTAYEDDVVLRQALQSGCSGYVNKAQDVGAVAFAIRAVMQGLVVSPEGIRTIPYSEGGKDLVSDDLTERELDVLRLIARGLSTAEICDELSISHNTVRNHAQRVITKLDAHSRLEAVIKASRLGVLPPSTQPQAKPIAGHVPQDDPHSSGD